VAGVGPWLEKAQIAARAQRYTEPPDDNALHYIERAEGRNAEVRGLAETPGERSAPSPGAQRLRTTFASALSVIGDELYKANLRELAVVKYREALLFTPHDPILQGKAELTPEEKQTFAQPPRVAARPAAPRTKTIPEQAREAAVRLFLAARDGRMSEARHQARQLRTIEASGVQAAKMADAVRKLADERGARGRRDEARSLYGLVAELDPQDVEARRLAVAPLEVPPQPAAPAAPPPVAEGLASAGAAPGKARARKAAADEDHDAPRDTAASRAATQEGRALVGRARLAEAEVAFNRAVSADPSNHQAVAGLAEVYFERAKYTDALDYARRATKLAPRNASYMRLLGDAYFKLYRYTEAKTAYLKAQHLSPDDATIASRLRQLRTKTGE
jgi:tetratricopeptide (TPR) repeat protein